MSRREKKPRKTDHDMVEALDKLAQFEDFSEKILPQLQKDIINGLSAEDMIKKYSNYAAARLVTDLARPNAIGSNSAKQILEQHLGKPTQKLDATHRYEGMSDEELDALLASEMSTDETSAH